MIFSSPVPFAEAAQSRAVRSVLPTTLRSAELRALGDAVRQRAVWSARVANAEYLDTVAGLTQDLVAGQVDLATARLQLGKLADLLDVPHDDARLNLIIETNLQTAQGYGQFAQANDPDVVVAFPAWELVRLEDRNEPRDWPQRWREAARAAGDNDAYAALDSSGRMAALKESGIWDQLGSLWGDSLGNPYPPFAYRSGMTVVDVGYSDTVALGLLDRGETVAPRGVPPLNADLELHADLRSAALRDALVREHNNEIEFRDGILTLKAA